LGSVIVCTLLYFNLPLETIGSIETRLSKNVYWMVLWKIYIFYWTEGHKWNKWNKRHKGVKKGVVGFDFFSETTGPIATTLVGIFIGWSSRSFHLHFFQTRFDLALVVSKIKVVEDTKKWSTNDILFKSNCNAFFFNP
jgi:hypothetical protein